MKVEAAIADFRRERQWLYSLIQDPEGKRFFLEKSRDTQQQQFEDGLARMAAFCDFAGNPERQFKSVHVAGTSGKGSVTTMIAALLTACGQRTGDHISPYLQISLEKLRVDGVMIAPSQFADLVRDFRHLYADWTATGRFLKYGEAWVALTYLWFAKAKPDWAVIETGMGGRYDPTNVLPSDLAVITNVDFDHVKSLGPNLADIARHKAGIIKPNGHVITAARKRDVLGVISAETHQKAATLQHLNATYHEDGAVTVRTPFQEFERLHLPVSGHFQRQNAALAITAVDWLAQQHNFSLTPDAIQQGLANLNYNGRFEHVQTAPTIILDGAHNPHKMQALVGSVQRAYPEQKLTIILGAIANKSVDGMFHALLPIAQRFILSEPKVFGKPAQPVADLVASLHTLAPDIQIDIAPDIQDAINHFLSAADEDDRCLITGSIYLIGEARERWYPQGLTLESLEATFT